MPYQVGQDIGGFGRLAEAQRWVKGQERLDIKEAQNAELINLQKEATKRNIDEVKRGRRVKAEYMQNVASAKPGEHYNTAYDYLVKSTKDNPDDADLYYDLLKQLNADQSEVLDDLEGKVPFSTYKKVYDGSFGKRFGHELESIDESHTEWDKVITLRTKDGTIVKMAPDKTAPDGIRDVTDILKGEEVKEKDETKIAAQTEKLRKEFQGLSKDYLKVRDSYTRIVKSAEDPSAAGDLALIFNYMKVLDPGSVVRESEFATAANAAGVPERVRAQWNKVKAGERLGDVQRRDFVDRAKRLYSGMEDLHGQRVQEYVRLAETQGLNPDLVITKMSPMVPPPEDSQPESKVVDFQGMDVQANLAPDGFYYIRSGDKYLKYVPEAE